MREKSGKVCFRASGLSLEKLLNEAGKREIRLWQVKRLENREIEIICTQSAYQAFREMAEEKDFRLTEGKPIGMYRKICRMKKRWALALGGFCCLGLLFFSMGFFWQIKVQGAGVYEGEVRLFLKEMGVHPGMLRGSLSPALLQEKLEWRLPKVKWVQAEYSGVCLVIRLEEGVPPPLVESEGASGNVVAHEDGILSRLITYAGTPAAKAGDFVRAGQVLIRGEERGEGGEMIPVKARGEALARIWIQTSAQAPLAEIKTEPTGESTERRVLATPFFSFSFADTPDYLAWDTERKQIPLGGAWIPMYLQREVYWEAALEKGERNIEQAKAEAARAALWALQKAAENEEMVDKWIEFSMIKGDTIVATATAEFLRDIGRYEKN